MSNRHQVLIVSEPFDYHAIAVHVALERRGVRVVRLTGSNIPQKMVGSIDLEEQPTFHLNPDVSLPPFSDITSVWNRRLAPPVLPDVEGLGNEESTYALEEMAEFWNSFVQTTGYSCFSVNSPDARTRSNSKVRQLLTAKSLSVNVPTTLISGDPARIHGFIDDNGGTAIYKPFFPHRFLVDGKRKFLFTSRVTRDELPEDKLLAMTPGIFQKEITKEYELRITMMGRTLFGVRIDSATTSDGPLDWRAEPLASLPVSSIPVSEEVAKACYAIGNALGIVFGCFDFIMDDKGRLVFLEVNQMGNFLWLEEMLPEVNMLETFCEFLVSREPDYTTSVKEPRSISYATIASSSEFNEYLELESSHVPCA